MSKNIHSWKEVRCHNRFQSSVTVSVRIVGRFVGSITMEPKLVQTQHLAAGITGGHHHAQLSRYFNIKRKMGKLISPSMMKNYATCLCLWHGHYNLWICTSSLTGLHFTTLTVKTRMLCRLHWEWCILISVWTVNSWKLAQDGGIGTAHWDTAVSTAG